MKRLVYHLSLTLIVAQLLLVLVSWLLSATLTEGVRSLLSAEGLRWFVGGYSRMLLTPLLAWLLTGAMAAGCALQSGIGGLLRWPKDYRQQLAFRIAVLLVAMYVVVLVVLAFIPHAVLLSATGGLWPSPFSDALVPLLSLAVIIVSAVYGLVVHRFATLADIFHSLVLGLSASAPLLLLYVLSVQLCESLRYVFFLA
ncbi:MAG: AbgT family transporter [Prevotella sp.]|nr:AbgT family transporter [Prevotella sp.]